MNRKPYISSTKMCIEYFVKQICKSAFKVCDWESGKLIFDDNIKFESIIHEGKVIGYISSNWMTSPHYIILEPAFAEILERE